MILRSGTEGPNPGRSSIVLGETFPTLHSGPSLVKGFNYRCGLLYTHVGLDMSTYMGQGAESLRTGAEGSLIQLLTTESTKGAHIINLDHVKPDLDL